MVPGFVPDNWAQVHRPHFVSFFQSSATLLGIKGSGPIVVDPETGWRSQDREVLESGVPALVEVDANATEVDSAGVFVNQAFYEIKLQTDVPLSVGHAIRVDESSDPLQVRQVFVVADVPTRGLLAVRRVRAYREPS